MRAEVTSQIAAADATEMSRWARVSEAKPCDPSSCHTGIKLKRLASRLD